MNSNINEDRLLWKAIQEGNEIAFKTLFEKYYLFLVQISMKQCGDESIGKDASQDVFVDLWKRKEQIDLSHSIQAYLRKAVVFKTIDYIRKKKNKVHFLDPTDLSIPVYSQDSLEYNDLTSIINKAVESLPPRCRQIFILSRHEQMSHKEIATELNISTKTIENQITRALKHLHLVVTPYLNK